MQIRLATRSLAKISPPCQDNLLGIAQFYIVRAHVYESCKSLWIFADGLKFLDGRSNVRQVDLHTCFRQPRPFDFHTRPDSGRNSAVGFERVGTYVTFTDMTCKRLPGNADDSRYSANA